MPRSLRSSALGQWAARERGCESCSPSHRTSARRRRSPGTGCGSRTGAARPRWLAGAGAGPPQQRRPCSGASVPAANTRRAETHRAACSGLAERAAREAVRGCGAVLFGDGSASSKKAASGSRSCAARLCFSHSTGTMATLPHRLACTYLGVACAPSAASKCVQTNRAISLSYAPPARSTSSLMTSRSSGSKPVTQTRTPASVAEGSCIKAQAGLRVQAASDTIHRVKGTAEAEEACFGKGPGRLRGGEERRGGQGLPSRRFADRPFGTSSRVLVAAHLHLGQPRAEAHQFY